MRVVPVQLRYTVASNHPFLILPGILCQKVAIVPTPFAGFESSISVGSDDSADFTRKYQIAFFAEVAAVIDIERLRMIRKYLRQVMKADALFAQGDT